MNSKIISAILIYISTFCISNAQEKEKAIQQFLSTEGLKHASVGMCIKDFSDNTIASYNGSKSYTPASILKVVTTASALEILGADYTYKTTLAKDKQNLNRLLIHGYGDPTLGTGFLDNDPTAFLNTWTEHIEQNYNPAEPIDILVIDNYFGYEGLSQRWIRQDIGNYYASGAYGISIFDNTYNLYFNTTRPDTCPIIVGTTPEMNLTFKNLLTLNNSGSDNGYIQGEPFSSHRTLIGNIPAGKISFNIKGDIPNPGFHLGETLSRYLNEQGFKIAKVETSYDQFHQQINSKYKTSNEEEIFYSHQSYALKDIIKDTNVRSNNHYAEHLIRTIGRTKNQDIYSSALDEGIAIIQNFWESKGLNTNGLFMYDGSGLSPSNAVSPEFMCDLLLYMQNKSENSDIFLNSLPKAGKEGTVRNFLKGTKLEGKVYAKSGSIANVQCFTGYYINGNKKYAFTIMVNKYNSPRNQVVKAIEKLLLNTF